MNKETKLAESLTPADRAAKERLTDLIYKQQYLLIPKDLSKNGFTKFSADAFLAEIKNIQPICEIYRSTMLPDNKSEGKINVITHVQGKGKSTVELGLYKLADPKGGIAYFSVIPEGVPTKGGKRYLVLQSLVSEKDYNEYLKNVLPEVKDERS